MVDKNFCISSFLAFRYIEDSKKDFCEGMHHRNIKPIPDGDRVLVKTADEIGHAIVSQMKLFEGKKKGILLSGGMDSAIVASYMK